MIIVDTREKKWQHIQKYFERNGIEYEVIKLDVGDYMNPAHPKVVIDRKKDLQEVCRNLSYGKGNYHRFLGECKRAYAAKQRLIVLIEEPSCSELADVVKWSSRYSGHTGNWLANEMLRLTRSYRVEWRFCSKRKTAEIIVRLTNGMD